ncbi:hypothetical protein P691DRAFT_799922 [Macrolepiota fuliginosa MF-IS2]|uniref:Uncharacterized protein n=1 Tax=Macrolepiota fuliginosa MF-IS2 TaxID=1400762 RepID=A0A9P5XQ70_9AGAR|nr:hypothetical protein P691DRAFT_799922 [Macrolepiota fuliginosa MF-IS2]
MLGGLKTIIKPYYPGGLSTNATGHFAPGRAYNVQYCRANIRQFYPPTLFLDDAILADGLEEYDQDLCTQVVQTPEPSLSCNDCRACWYTPDEDVEEELDDGMISPLELPPPLLSFGTADGVKSESVPPESQPKLDLKELDRRLESIARIERLEKAGLLHAFFAGAARI